jgi:2-isopropylmalate synthase
MNWHSNPQARVVLSVEGKEVVATADTSGAVDATFSAINSLVDVEVNLQLYSVSNVTHGKFFVY